MKLFSNKNKEIYFLSKEGKISSESKVDLILSPEFYWVRIFTIPVTMAKSAVKVLPSIFEDILADKHYDYHAIKMEKHKFMCFAYDNNEILKVIKNSGLTLSQINSVYFAQTEMIENESFTIENISFIYEKELLVKMPKGYLINSEQLDCKLSHLLLTGNKINIKFYENRISLKYVYHMVVLLSLIILTNTMMYMSYEKEINNINLRIKEIKEGNNIPVSTLQMNAIFNEMKGKVSQNRKLREIVLHILKYTKTKQKVNVKKIIYLNDMLEVVFSNANMDEIKKHIEKKYKNSKSSLDRNSIRVLVEI